MPIAVIAEEATDPVQVGLLGTDGVVLDAQGCACLVEQGGEVRRRDDRVTGCHGEGVTGRHGDGGWGIGGQVEGVVEDLAIEEEDRGARRGAFGVAGEGFEKRHDFGSGYGGRMAPIVKKDEACEPGDTGFFGVSRIVACAQGCAHTST